MTKRLLDIAVALALSMLLLPVMLVVAMAVRLTSPGPVLFWSERFGRDSAIFRMPKFRTMRTGTPNVATHLLAEGAGHLTPIGGFLRSTSLDELPQLFSVLKGDMSFVGPRPALFNQYDLMDMRRQAGVDALAPGITGWAQVNGRDNLTLEEKVVFEREYLDRASLAFDLRILLVTVFKVLSRRGVHH